jgi:acetyltransferase-like isoleucine patch superfamily enzyme
VDPKLTDSRQIASTARIHPNVTLGENVVVEDYCIIGCPPRGRASGELPTVIGADSVIRSHTVVYAGNTIGHHFQTGNGVNIRESNQIGNEVSIGTHSVIEHHVEIADGVRIHTQAFIPEYCQLGKHAWVGPNVVLTNAAYPASPKAKETLRGVVLKEKARIGANSTLLPGVVIGRNSLVGAGSTVTKDVPDDSVAYGNPATVRKPIAQLPY